MATNVQVNERANFESETSIPSNTTKIPNLNTKFTVITRGSRGKRRKERQMNQRF